jgi:hypothetical protein
VEPKVNSIFFLSTFGKAFSEAKSQNRFYPRSYEKASKILITFSKSLFCSLFSRSNEKRGGKELKKSNCILINGRKYFFFD